MRMRYLLGGAVLISAVLLAIAVGCSNSQGSVATTGGDAAPPPAATSDGGQASQSPGQELTPSQLALQQGLEMADASLKLLEDIHDYSTVFIKQERIGGVLLDEETMQMKIRNEPFSVYVKHLAPDSMKGQEAIFVKGKNNDRLVAHAAPGLLNFMTVRLPTDGYLAMSNNRHSINDAGMIKMLHQLKELARREADYIQTCTIQFIEGETVDGRPVYCLEVRSPKPTATVRLAIARIYLDKEWNLPVKYEEWQFPPDNDQGEPILVERYTYTQVQFNQNLTDLDFDPANKSYNYPAAGR